MKKKLFRPDIYFIWLKTVIHQAFSIPKSETLILWLSQILPSISLSTGLYASIRTFPDPRMFNSTKEYENWYRSSETIVGYFPYALHVLNKKWPLKKVFQFLCKTIYNNYFIFRSIILISWDLHRSVSLFSALLWTFTINRLAYLYTPKNFVNLSGRINQEFLICLISILVHSIIVFHTNSQCFSFSAFIILGIGIGISTIVFICEFFSKKWGFK